LLTSAGGQGGLGKVFEFDTFVGSHGELIGLEKSKETERNDLEKKSIPFICFLTSGVANALANEIVGLFFFG
jgi:hypothetical protein